MKGWILLIVVVILIILMILAWRKETIDEPVSTAFSTPVRIKRKAKKSRMPNTREEKCRDILESLTGEAFPTDRPWWLTNPKTGRRLELDGYSEKLRVAFEYNGKQHYEFPNSYHKTREEFDRQVERDNFKMEECRKRGVNLLVIPYDLEDDELHDFIKQRLATSGR